MRLRARSACLTLAVLTGLTLACPATAAPSNKPAKPSKQATPSKPTQTTKTTPPAVNTLPIRDGLQAGGEDRITRRKPRDGSSDPKKPVVPASDPPKRPAGGRPPRDNPPTSIDDDLQLNIGICGRVQPDGTVPGPNRCQLVIPEERDITLTRVRTPLPPRPQDVTWEEVRSETKNVIFPGLSVKVQPTGRTLVNLDTIVYTDDSKVSTTTVTLLGFPVVVEATPISYTWRFGDGSPALTTSTPGKPYPSKEITHKYMRRGDVSLTLTTNYAARFNVADTGWQYVQGTIPVTGPATALQVREAVPVLVDPDR
jgi:PKD domain